MGSNSRSRKTANLRTRKGANIKIQFEKILKGIINALALSGCLKSKTLHPFTDHSDINYAGMYLSVKEVSSRGHSR